MTQHVVLVTGGAGYIGSHVCKLLSQNGFLPVVYDNLSSGNREAVKWGPFEEGDIRDRARLAAVIEQYKPTSLMHFAALIQVGESVQNPSVYYDNNVHGSWCLLEEARAHNIKNIVFSSTAAVYGNPQTDAITETHPLRPINPYGHTKLATENMIRDYAQAYPLHYAILRYFNAAGADPDAETGTAYKKDTHIIPMLMHVVSGTRPEFSLFGTDYDTPDGTAIRDYIHVTDLAQAHIAALCHIHENGENLTLNLGTSQGRTARELIETARSVTGHTLPVQESPRREGDPAVLVADATKAQKVLNWRPVRSDIATIVDTAWQWKQKQNLYGKTEAFTASNTDQPTQKKVVK
ncbi:MAG: UDP-glucose 4-epimerase GalE [Rhodospirillales bacterium]|nr:UDP-glucose 4-epimerase GalE [Rhodospirillales bacterium]